jgi:hypothetical protein
MMTTLMTGRIPLAIMWNREQLTPSLQKTLSPMIIAALKWTPLTIVFTGKDDEYG